MTSPASYDHEANLADRDKDTIGQQIRQGHGPDLALLAAEDDTPAAEEITEKNLSDNPFVFVPENREYGKVELIYPLEDSEGHEVADVLRMRRPKVDDSIIAEKLAEGDKNALFISRLANICEVPHDAMETLDELDDMENLVEAYGLLGDYDGEAAGNPNIEMAENRRSVVVTLRHPLKHGKNEAGEDQYLTELTMRRPQLRDSTEAEKKSKWPTEVLAHKYAALCGVPLEVIKQLDDIDDFSSLDQAFGFFRRAKIDRRKQR